MKDLTRNLLMKLGLGVLTLSAVTSVAAVPMYLEYNLTTPEAKTEWSSLFLLGPGGKLNDSWKFSSETLINVPHASRTSSILYSRINFKNTKVAEFGGWNLDVNYRYLLPVLADQYNANNFGTVYVRPELSQKFGDFGALIRNTFSYALSEKYKRADRSKSNAHFGYTLELIPDFAFNEEFSLSAYLALAYNYFPSDRGATNSGFARRVIWDVFEIGYTSPAIDNWGLAFTLENDTKGGRKAAGVKDPWVDSKLWAYILKVTKVF